MIKISKYNCGELSFKVCNECNHLLQFKGEDINWIIKNDKIVYGEIVCPHCKNIIKIEYEYAGEERIDRINLKDSQKEYIKNLLEDTMIDIRRRYYLCEGSEDEEIFCPKSKSEFEAVSSLANYLGIEIDILFEY